jgi:hypothetical protein
VAGSGGSGRLDSTNLQRSVTFLRLDLVEVMSFVCELREQPVRQ